MLFGESRTMLEVKFFGFAKPCNGFGRSASRHYYFHSSKTNFASEEIRARAQAPFRSEPCWRSSSLDSRNRAMGSEEAPHGTTIFILRKRISRVKKSERALRHHSDLNHVGGQVLWIRETVQWVRKKRLTALLFSFFENEFRE